MSPSKQQQQQHRESKSRAHLVVVVGTASGKLKKLVIAQPAIGPSGDELNKMRSAREFESMQLDENNNSILADLTLLPSEARAVSGGMAGDVTIEQQFAIVATSAKVAKLRINACSAASPKLNATTKSSAPHQQLDECEACASLSNPYCGWCETELGAAPSCTTREHCARQAPHSAPRRWLPFDKISCATYAQIAPRQLVVASSASPRAFQASSDNQITSTELSVNIKLVTQRQRELASVDSTSAKLALLRFVCEFEHSSAVAPTSISRLAPQSQQPQTKQLPSTLARRARLDLFASAVVLRCPLPTSLRNSDNFAEPLSAPDMSNQSSLKVGGRLRVRVSLDTHATRIWQAAAAALLNTSNSTSLTNDDDAIPSSTQVEPSSDQQSEMQFEQQISSPLDSDTETLLAVQHRNFFSTARTILIAERIVELIDCKAHRTCSECLSSSDGVRTMCAWSSTSNRCDVAGEDESYFESLEQCASSRPLVEQIIKHTTDQINATLHIELGEILIPSHTKAAPRLYLSSDSTPVSTTTELRRAKHVECLLELTEGGGSARMRTAAKLSFDSASSSFVVDCGDTQVAYSEHQPTSKATLTVLASSRPLVVAPNG